MEETYTHHLFRHRQGVFCPISGLGLVLYVNSSGFSMYGGGLDNDTLRYLTRQGGDEQMLDMVAK